ncbi:MAG: polyribonucleotide nucleotidyltransferase, partial [Dehalococcoidia bacterium]
MNTAAQTRVFTRDIEGQAFEIGLGTLAPHALSSCTVRYGDSVILVTVSDGDPRAGIDFFPLTVDYEERMYAIGKVPGSFFRREGRPGTEATLTARMTDRPIRPLFPKGFKREVHIVSTLLSADRINPAEALATVGASMVVNNSHLPFEGPVSSVRVARVDGRWKAFPTYEELAASDLELTVAATDDSVVMIEAGGKQIPEEDLIEAIEYAEGVCRELNGLQREIMAEFAQPKMEWVRPEDTSELRARIESALEGQDEFVFSSVMGEGFRGFDIVAKYVMDRFAEQGDEEADRRVVTAETEAVIKTKVRNSILEHRVRA